MFVSFSSSLVKLVSAWVTVTPLSGQSMYHNCVSLIVPRCESGIVSCVCKAALV